MGFRTYTDQLGRNVEISFPPKRIISLVPSQTELLAYIGLEDEVTGITKFCIHPEDWFKSKKRVGGTKKLNLEIIRKLNPDLIIGNKEENEQIQIQELMKEYPVWMSDIKSLEDALEMILSIGELTSRKEKSVELMSEIKLRFSKLQPAKKQKRAAYFIWQKPYMVVAGDTFINDMMRRCGFDNVFANGSERYPEVTAEEIAAAKPEVILLSSEPFPFKKKHVAEFKFICPESGVQLVDGEMFSWYGSRQLKAVDYFQELIGNLKM